VLKKNMGLIDRLIRIAVGILLIYLGAINADIIMNTVVRYCLVGFGVINVATSIIAICPMYKLIDISTAKK